MISKKNYDDSTIKIMSEKFDKLFILYFPSLTDYICKNNNDITTNQQIQYKENVLLTYSMFLIVQWLLLWII